MSLISPENAPTAISNSHCNIVSHCGISDTGIVISISRYSHMSYRPSYIVRVCVVHGHCDSSQCESILSQQERHWWPCSVRSRCQDCTRYRRHWWATNGDRRTKRPVSDVQLPSRRTKLCTCATSSMSPLMTNSPQLYLENSAFFTALLCRSQRHIFATRTE